MTSLFEVLNIESLTPDVLTRILEESPHFEDAVVDTLVTTPIGTGQLARSYRIELGYARGGGPSSLVAKVPSDDEASRAMARMTAAYEREVRFYADIASDLPVRTPACFASQLNDDGSEFFLLLQDLTPVQQADQIAGASREQASAAIEQAAALHASSWGAAHLDRDWLPVESVWGALAGSVPGVAGPWLARFGEHLSREQVVAVERLGSHVGAWVSTLSEQRSLWHGDFRLDNLLFTGTGPTEEATVIDWQSVATGPGTIDISYFLGNSLTPSDRARYEREIVVEYHERLRSHGVDSLTWDQLWREYRMHSVFGLLLILPVSLGVESTERGDAMFGAMASRAAAQVVELEALDEL